MRGGSGVDFDEYFGRESARRRSDIYGRSRDSLAASGARQKALRSAWLSTRMGSGQNLPEKDYVATGSGDFDDKNERQKVGKISRTCWAVEK